MSAALLVALHESAIGPTRTSGDVRIRAAVKRIADIKRRLDPQRPDL